MNTPEATCCWCVRKDQPIALQPPLTNRFLPLLLLLLVYCSSQDRSQLTARSSATCAVSGCARQQGAGIDSTELFDDVGHSDEATGMLKQYYIGELSD